MLIKIKCLTNETSELYKNHKTFHQGDSGLDIYFPEDVTVEGGAVGQFINLGISAEAYSINDRNVMFINSKSSRRQTSYWMLPRSSISKTPLRMSNSIGLIDAEYRGEFKVVVDNRSSEPYHIKRGERLFQIAHPELVGIRMETVNKLTKTERGSGGFGSTGK